MIIGLIMNECMEGGMAGWEQTWDFDLTLTAEPELFPLSLDTPTCLKKKSFYLFIFFAFNAVAPACLTNLTFNTFSFVHLTSAYSGFLYIFVFLFLSSETIIRISKPSS